MLSLKELPGTLSIAKTISESDVYLYAGIMGDFSPWHLNAEYCKGTPIGERIVHGAIILGLMSAASTNWCKAARFDALNYGYDRVRYIKPVKFGDTITVSFTPDSQREDKHGVKSLIAFRVEAHNQHKEIVAAAINLLKYIPVKDGLAAREW